jgi:hypothetical protein
MYYAKLSNAFNLASGRDIDNKYPADPLGFEKQRPEWEIVGAFAADPIKISTIESGSGGTASVKLQSKLQYLTNSRQELQSRLVEFLRQTIISQQKFRVSSELTQLSLHIFFQTFHPI